MQAQMKNEMPRQRWMRALALGEEKALEEALRQYPSLPIYSYLRKPETGMLMLEGKAGSTGQRFNVGEMLVTRCAVALEHNATKFEGHAYIMGNKPRHAAMAAVLDALMQCDSFSEDLETRLVAPLLEKHAQKQENTAVQTAATKVDFFTMVRGEDA